ncbi:FkbM family methyltransferase [Phenylobacterium sp. VNQ135]|uniref:FkbM family methyltransferase n=1 Tax=Phenylobacterium sp. VNQ135 TaxID=3400922 RepID=UPI003C0E5D0A
MNRSPSKIEALQTLLQRGVSIGTILDVGVLTGTPELMEVFPTVKHVLFEPVVEFAAQIHESYAAIPHELVSAAVSDRSGETTLAVSTVIEGWDISHSSMVDEPPAAGERVVPMLTVDDWVRQNNPQGPYFLKIDIDGHELRVLNGAQQTLQDTAIVMIEAPANLITERIKPLQDAGFELFDLVEPAYYDGMLWQCDAIFISKAVKTQHFKNLKDGFEAELWHVWRG